jgi:Tol biopolymer transport system component
MKHGNTLTWVDRNGRETALPLEPDAYIYARSSPHGEYLLLNIDMGNIHIWAYEIERGNKIRLTLESSNIQPLWMPDSKRIVYVGGNGTSLHWQAVDQSDEVEQIFQSEDPLRLGSLSPDGRLLSFSEQNPTTGFDIWVLPIHGDRIPQLVVGTSYNEHSPQFSHDGKWLAYESDEAGEYEVYAQPYPGPGRRLKISTGGGGEPLWAPSGKEIYYRSTDAMMAVDWVPKPSAPLGMPRRLFTDHYWRSLFQSPNYDVAPDGERFLMIKHAEPLEAAPINIVLNWFEELKRLVPTGN